MEDDIVEEEFDPEQFGQAFIDAFRNADAAAAERDGTQIDAIEFSAKTSILSVRICTNEIGQGKKYLDKTIRCIFYVFDFYDVELEYIDIAPEHWIDDIVIQRNSDRKNSISFGSGGLDFRYSHAKVNRTWIEYEK